MKIRFISRILFSFLEHWGWTWIHLISIQMKKYGKHLSYLIWKDLSAVSHPCWTMSAQRVERILGKEYTEMPFSCDCGWLRLTLVCHIRNDLPTYFCSKKATNVQTFASSSASATNHLILLRNTNPILSERSFRDRILGTGSPLNTLW